jgi:exo-beta-1,3-glucanase (GH17 family)
LAAPPARDKPVRSLATPYSGPLMRLGFGLFALSAAAILAVWSWLGTPVAMPQSPGGGGEKLYCISYAPFRDGQTPFDLSTHISAQQIDEDLSQLARLTDCVRTYSVDYGLDQIPEIAGRHGLKVIQGLWLSSKADKNRDQIEVAVALAIRFPNVIRAIVVGNEVLLRGEMSPVDLANTIRAVKARVTVPVTYADVWEFWLRNRELATAVDFITIHILPYWEDFPIPARDAAAHVDSIHKRVAAAFPGKDIIIGEVGWPSEGRMREGALPSPSNQARVIQDVLALANTEKFRVNVIEAYDQSWKRLLEGTVGGHWGLINAQSRAFKFTWGEGVSDHPLWRWQAAGGILFAALVFGVAWAARGRNDISLGLWLAVCVNALAGGGLIGWAFANMSIESLGVGGWLRSLVLAAVTFSAPPMVSAAMTARTALPRFSRILGSSAGRVRDWRSIALGVILILLALVAIQIALGLSFDPRYRDFPFAPLTAAVVPFLMHSVSMTRSSGARGAAEIAAAGVLALSASYIAINEGFANWQSLWLCIVFAALAFTLARVRDAQN